MYLIHLTVLFNCKEFLVLSTFISTPPILNTVQQRLISAPVNVYSIAFTQMDFFLLLLSYSGTLCEIFCRSDSVLFSFSSQESDPMGRSGFALFLRIATHSTFLVKTKAAIMEILHTMRLQSKPQTDL